MYYETEISLLQIIIEGAEENMNRKEYEKTDDYIESIKIIEEFIREMLDGGHRKNERSGFCRSYKVYQQ